MEIKKEDYERLSQLLAKDQMSEKEFEQLEFLQKAAEQADRTAVFRENQKQSYKSKVSRAVNLAWEFYRNIDIDGKCYVAVGGLDSITLYVFLRSIGIDVPAVKEWEMWMTHVCQDENGNWYGWDRVLDYIGVKWEHPEDILGQMMMGGIRRKAQRNLTRSATSVFAANGNGTDYLGGGPA